MRADPLHRLRAYLAAQLRDIAPGRRQRTRSALDALAACVGDRPALRLLDAGCEDGRFAVEVAARYPGWTVVAADIAEEPLRRGRSRAAAEGARVAFVRCDLQRPLGEEVYDVVVALESLVEIPDDQAALTSLAAALRPRGLLVAQVPTADWTPVLPTAERAWRREARHGYDADELRRLLEERGLTVRRLTPTFHRLTALAQDVRDHFKRRGRWVQLGLLPLMAGAVAAERVGVRIGSPRALFVVAEKRSS